MNPQQQKGTIQQPVSVTLQNRLYGGLKGRIRNSLNAVGNALEVFADYLKRCTNPQQYAELQPLLAEVDVELNRVRRLTEYTADVALGTALRQMYSPHVMDLVGQLKMLCQVFAEEAPLAEYPANVVVDTGGQDLIPVMGEEHMLCAMLANLLSNAVSARADCTVTFTCNEKELVYRDDGPGLTQDAVAMLCGEAWPPELMKSGGIGLLLIYRYTQAMGWSLQVEQPEEGGTCIRFALPPCAVPDRGHLVLNQGTALENERYCRTLLRRELAALQTPAGQ